MALTASATPPCVRHFVECAVAQILNTLWLSASRTISLKVSIWSTRTCTKLFIPSIEITSSTRYVFARPLILQESISSTLLQIRYISSPDRQILTSDVQAFISSLHTRRGRPSSGIVYCRNRTTCDELALYLRQRGISARAYHKGLKWVIPRNLMRLF